MILDSFCNSFLWRCTRCYFRCTHKQDGCKALKQVQRVQKGDQVLYQITYFNHHSCKDTPRAPPLMLPSEPLDPNLISFQTLKNQDEEDDHACNKSSSRPLVLSSVKQEDSMSDGASHEAGSTLEDPWQDITGLEPLGYKPLIWAPYQDEVESSLHGLDMEVNQLSDILNFHYFD